jgi:class 3 adenylate cyclase
VPAVRVPTLIVHNVDDPVCHVENARFLARNIPGAKFVELPGNIHIPWAEAATADDILAEIREFLTGVREAPEPDRVLATVLFTDIVGSTEKQAAIGGHAWKELIQRHHAIVREGLERWHGVEADTAGDGFFATFDGPARAIRCALDIAQRVRELGIEVRAGVHTGECEIVDAKCTGIAVSIGARVASTAGPSEVHVSQTVRDLVAGSGLVFKDAGEHELKGVPDRWRLYSAASG